LICLKKIYSEINIQYPISSDIISGAKTIETRTYPLPDKFKGVEMVLIETPGKTEKFKARAIAIIRFSDSFEYPSAREFYKDESKHLVSKEFD